MVPKDEEFLKRLLATFKVEAGEHLQAITAGLLKLEKDPSLESRPDLINTIFREAHSLKGAARAVNLSEIEAICQALESIFARWKRQAAGPSPEEFDLLHQAVDLLTRLTAAGQAASKTAEKSRIRALLLGLDHLAQGLPGGAAQASYLKSEKVAAEPAVSTPPPQVENAAPESVRVSLPKLQKILQQSDEFLTARLAARQILTEINQLNSTLLIWRTERDKIQPLVRALQHQTGADASRQDSRVLEFLQWAEAYHKLIEGRAAQLARSAEQGYWQLSRQMENLGEELKKLLMLPFQPALEVLPRLVRDLARSSGKEAELIILGGEIEIDRRVLEEIKDPLVHLVRNCIDHGIEAPEERRRCHKPTVGKITISIVPLEGSKVEVSVSDDGAGIDAAKVRQAAIKLGLLTLVEAEQADDSDLLNHIFAAGLSTSPIITDISGRGLGLAILREKAEKLGGSYSMETKSGEGTTFRLVLPITVATFRGTLVRLGTRFFIVPTRNVEQVLRVNRDGIHTVENRETIDLNGRAVALVRLAEVLELPAEPVASESSDQVRLVVLTSAEKRLAFGVDEVLYEQEVLEKPLGDQLSRVRNVSGVTILGTGALAPILNVTDLFKSALKVSHRPGRSAHGEVAAEAPAAVLVAEDSITARTLLKNILQAAGYRVETAVDGLDAFGKLQGGGFDLVVSDVDMPQMNGFDLTEKIRRDRKLRETPVVLVTALESKEDREHGIEVGANAYIVKSSFDQSNLLETLKRLI
ncbi:MAG: hybrid sensor histidine kinase/response regulator [Deltaproteobacteria bacterium]|nr:hybrid sensor histidine kinase/response regulator [Deltaproteobacteria bacterium]